MKREIAEQIAHMTKKIDDILGALYVTLDQIDNDEERKKFQEGVAKVIFATYDNITREAVRDFPDLHPDDDFKKRKGLITR